MVKINVQEECKNSPKKEFIRDFEIAFANGDASFILNSFDENIIWNIVGQKTITGYKDVESEVKGMMDSSMNELTIEKIITHGNTGAANGIMKFKDGSTFGFCDVFIFSGHDKKAKVKKISAYIVEMK